MLFSIDESNPQPLYLQLVMQVKDQIRNGNLVPGDELPSVRELADILGINLHTIHNAYKKLRDEGLITLRLGQRAKIARRRQQPLSDSEIDSAIGARLHDLATDAYLLGISGERLREFINNYLEHDIEGQPK